MALKFSTSLRNARADEIATAVGNAGVLRIYDGTRPASVGTAITTQVLLAELTCGSPLAPAASPRVPPPLPTGGLVGATAAPVASFSGIAA